MRSSPPGAITSVSYTHLDVYKRQLLKLSGEALAGEKKTGFDEPTVMKVAEQVKTLVDQGIEVGIVIGGGNFWRGRSSENIDRTKADQIGMLATVMNCIYVSEIFRAAGMKTAVMTPFACGAFTAVSYTHLNHMERLQEKTCTFEQGLTFIESLNSLMRIVNHVMNIAEASGSELLLNTARE